MDRTKDKWLLGIELTARNMATLHNYYLYGIAKETFSEDERRRAYSILELLEKCLTQSGYFNEMDIRLRHAGWKKEPASDDAPLVWTPPGMRFQ